MPSKTPATSKHGGTPEKRIFPFDYPFRDNPTLNGIIVGLIFSLILIWLVL